MNIHDVTPEWRGAVEALLGELSLKTVADFKKDGDQADCLVWTPQHSAVSLEAISAFGARVTTAGFLVLPFFSDEECASYRRALGDSISIYQWLPFAGNPGMVIATVRKWNVLEAKEIIGAMKPEDRWLQIKANSERIKQRLPMPQPAHDRRCILICFAPSLNQTWRMAIDEAKYTGGAVVTCSGSHDFMIKKKLVPHYHVEIDPREAKCGILKAPHEDVTYLMASTVAPKWFDKLKDNRVILWHSMNGEESARIFELEPDAQLVAGGACVGLRSISLFYALGYRTFSIYGFDCSFKNDDQIWAGARPKISKHPAVEVKCGDRVFKTSPLLRAYAMQFMDMMRQVPDAQFYVHGDGLLQHMGHTAVKLFNERMAKEKAA